MTGRDSTSLSLPPVAIGGVGGSGTRVVAHILRELGFHMGDDVNFALDNLWFTLLFRRPGMHEQPYEDLKNGLTLFEKAMLGERVLTPGEISFRDQAVRESEDVIRLGGLELGGERWTQRRSESLRHAAGPGAGHLGWGWKEPCTHVFLESLYRELEGLRYIHIIRSGLDLARKPLTYFDLLFWGKLYGLEAPPALAEETPSVLLDFWVQCNRRAIKKGEEIFGDRFLLVRYEQMCESPRTAIEAIAHFIGVRPNPGQLNELTQFVHAAPPSQRDPVQDRDYFAPDDLAAVEAMGFTI